MKVKITMSYRVHTCLKVIQEREITSVGINVGKDVEESENLLQYKLV